MDTAVAPSFGALLKSYRIRAGMSQELLAQRAGLSVETISSLERGARRNPYRDTIALLATALAASEAERTRLESAASRPAVRRGPAVVRASLQSVSGPSGNVPVALTSFVGREPEVAAAAALLSAKRFVTLTGPGGVGKTRLALRLAASRYTNPADGVWFVEFGSLTDQMLVPGTVASALHLVLPTDRQPVSALCSIVARQQLLLILDNCEHLLAAVGALANALLLNCPHVVLLATSRQPLGIAGEATFSVPPLSLPDAETAATLTLSAATNFEALTLFVDRARAVQPNFALTAENVPIVADISRRLDGIPLAIELAATRIKLLSLRDLRDRLDERLRILTGGPRDALPRLQTLRALIAWSYDLLDDCERRFFRGVSVFAGGFTLEAATAVCRGDATSDTIETFDLLASLVDKSLIVAAIDGDLTRYGLLESTRLYALEMLAESGERAGLEERHLAFFCEAAASSERTIERSGSDALLVRLVSDIENIRAALRHAVASGDCSTGAALAVGAARLFRRLGRSAEGIGWLEASLTTVDQSDLRLQSRIWSGITFLVGNTGGARSREAAERSVALARAAGDRELLAWALTHRAVADIDELRRDDAGVALAEATELFGPDVQDHQRARIVAVRHHIARLVGDMPAALEIGEELCRLYRRIGHQSGELATMTNQAEILHGLGKTRSAIAVARQTLERTAPTDRNTRMILQLNLCGYLAAVGDPTAARAAGRNAIGLLKGDHVGWTIAAAIGHLALAHALSGDIPRAARLSGYWNGSSSALAVSRESTERITYELLSALLAKHLSVTELETLFHEGASLAPADAILEALGE